MIQFIENSRTCKEIYNDRKLDPWLLGVGDLERQVGGITNGHRVPLGLVDNPHYLGCGEVSQVYSCVKTVKLCTLNVQLLCVIPCKKNWGNKRAITIMVSGALIMLLFGKGKDLASLLGGKHAEILMGWG